MQCLPLPEQSEAILLSQFEPNVTPHIGNFYLLQGIYDGIPALFNNIEPIACEEVFSQLTLSQVIAEFKNYHLRQKGAEEISIVETTSGREVAVAKKIALATETIPSPPDNGFAHDGIVIPPHHQQVTLLSPRADTQAVARQDDRWVYEVVREGSVAADGLSFPLRKGWRFNAPYSRFRFQWRPKWRQKVVSFTRRRSEVVPFLLNHMRELREAHLQLLRQSVENQALIQANLKLKKARRGEACDVIGESPVIRKLLEQIRLVGPTDSVVLLMGETGSGKEVLAKAVHGASLRQDQPLHAVNCAAFTDTLLEAELFGYERGAFTGATSTRQGLFEAASGGSIFLDEVGDCSPNMQAKLLRVLETQELYRIGNHKPISVDVRLIAATNKDLSEQVASGRFRQDLFYRLHVISFLVPPLRERPEDIPLLIDHFLDVYCLTYRKERPTLTQDAYQLLTNYPWPGNVRQLKNVLERAIVLHQNRVITPAEIVLTEASPRPPSNGRSLQEGLDLRRRAMIEEALRKSGGNQTKAASLLGIQRTYLARLIRLSNIESSV
jgi:DNA-binding NtrC family response regulator